jgi:hypothetical protein
MTGFGKTKWHWAEARGGTLKARVTMAPKAI